MNNIEETDFSPVYTIGIASKLTDAPRLERLYRHAEELVLIQEEIQKESEDKIKHLQEAGKNLPTLE